MRLMRCNLAARVSSFGGSKGASSLFQQPVSAGGSALCLGGYRARSANRGPVGPRASLAQHGARHPTSQRSRHQ
jgi:hypothetical protein